MKKTLFGIAQFVAVFPLVSCTNDGSQTKGAATVTPTDTNMGGGAGGTDTSLGTEPGAAGSGTNTGGAARGAGGGTTGGAATDAGGAAAATATGGAVTGTVGDPGVAPNIDTSAVPFKIKGDMFDQSKKDDLGLTKAVGTETVTVFAPSESTDHFSNGVVLIGFKGRLYCQWQSSAESEDTGDTWVAYSSSADGTTWSAPAVLAESLPSGYRSSGGWWTSGETLVGYVNVWPSSISPRGGYTEFTTSTDGTKWTELKRLQMADGKTLDGIFEQDPHALRTGRIISAAHFQPGLVVAPVYTDDPTGTGGWVRASYTNMPGGGELSREIEPSWYERRDGAAVMTFRDQKGSNRRLASISLDRGSSWTTPVLTDMPDSRTKQSAGNLPDGTAYLVGNPVDGNVRIPLVVTLSDDGKVFDRSFLLRGGSELKEPRFGGNAKKRGYAYPKSMVWQDYLYVAYAKNKEDVEYTRVPLSSL